MKLLFHPDAEMELREAANYYDDCQTGLGLDFAEEVYAAISRIIKYPDAWSRLSSNTRRCLTNRFPFGIIYQVKSDNLYIIAIANLHRRPEYWKERA